MIKESHATKDPQPWLWHTHFSKRGNLWEIHLAISGAVVLFFKKEEEPVEDTSRFSDGGKTTLEKGLWTAKGTCAKIWFPLSDFPSFVGIPNIKRQLNRNSNIFEQEVWIGFTVHMHISAHTHSLCVLTSFPAIWILFCTYLVYHKVPPPTLLFLEVRWGEVSL